MAITLIFKNHEKSTFDICVKKNKEQPARLKKGDEITFPGNDVKDRFKIYGEDESGERKHIWVDLGDSRVDSKCYRDVSLQLGYKQEKNDWQIKIKKCPSGDDGQIEPTTNVTVGSDRPGTGN